MTLTTLKSRAIIFFDDLPCWFRYGLSALAVAVAAIATHYMPVIGERAAFLFFFFAITQASIWFGRNQGLFAMVLSLIAVNKLHLFPIWNSKPVDIFILNAGFCGLSAILIETTSRHRNSIQALKESQKRFAGIVDSAMDAIITLDANQRIILFNAAAEKMFGYRASEAIGGSIDRLLPERFRNAHGQHMYSYESNGSTNRKMGELGTVIGLRANGEEFPIEASISKMKMRGEKSYTAILRDVTERQQAELALKEQLRLQDQLTKIAATVPGVIYAFRMRPDGSYCLPYASSVFESLFGLSYDIVAKDCSPVFTRINPNDLPHIYDTIAESARTLHPWRDTFRYQHPTKGDIWFEGHSMPVREMDGGVLWQGYIQDITDRKEAEETLRNTLTRLALTVDVVQLGYWDWDLKTRTLYVSPEWKRQIGFDDSELTDGPEPKEDRLHPDDRELVKTATENFIAGSLPVNELEFRLQHKDGSYRWIHSRAALQRDADNQPCRMLGINLDITEYMRAKELNEQREKMEQSFRLYVASQTAAAIAHELNQPLTAISCYTDAALLMLQSGNQNPDKFSQVLENCSFQAQRAGEVMRQLTTLLHKGEINSEPIDINLTAQESLDYVKADVHLGTFKIALDLAADLAPVLGDHLQIQKVLITLLRNGLESMQEAAINDGTITVTTRRSDSDPSFAQVTVCDSGKGVEDAGILKNMFKPFHTTKAAGLGMGLAISRALIEAHGGKIWADQNADAGISIHLTLPFVI